MDYARRQIVREFFATETISAAWYSFEACVRNVYTFIVRLSAEMFYPR
jgi:hypothetical protein